MRVAQHSGFLWSIVLRWIICTLGLWIAAGLLGGGVSYGNKVSAVFIGGFVLALINVLLRPLLILASLPALLLTLGLFMVVINGLTVYLASKLYAPLHVTNFWAAIATGLIIGLVNYLVTAILEER